MLRTVEGMPRTVEGMPKTVEGMPKTVEGMPRTVEGMLPHFYLHQCNDFVQKCITGSVSAKPNSLYKAFAIILSSRTSRVTLQ